MTSSCNLLFTLVSVILGLAYSFYDVEPKCANGAAMLQLSSHGDLTKKDHSRASVNQRNSGKDIGTNQRDTGCSGRKLIINSHVDYQTPLRHLVASLKQYNFERFQDIVVFRGGAERDSNPYIGTDGMTFVDLGVNSYDLNSMYGLAKYKNHSAICAEMYFYIHDTTMVGPCFAQVFDEIEIAPTEVIIPGLGYFSNQCVFGASLVDRFGHGFDRSIPKEAGFVIEAGGCSGDACAVQHYAEKQIVIPYREHVGEIDLYSTGLPRRCKWYKDFDIYKCLLYQPSHNPSNLLKDFGHDSSHLQQMTMSNDKVRDVVHPNWAQSCSRRQVLKVQTFQMSR